jgi:glycine/D-amino acid oxidase-like deaminating enzyme
MQSQYFKHLPFTPNKGEALIIECTDLPRDYNYKNTFSIVPWTSNLFWVGASFKWKFDTEQPTTLFKNEATSWLNSFLKLPYKMVDHIAAIRPANKDRKPFVGFHPQYKNIGILNGMGSKGVLYTPYFANDLANLIVKKV